MADHPGAHMRVAREDADGDTVAQAELLDECAGGVQHRQLEARQVVEAVRILTGVAQGGADQGGDLDLVLWHRASPDAVVDAQAGVGPGRGRRGVGHRCQQHPCHVFVGILVAHLAAHDSGDRLTDGGEELLDRVVVPVGLPDDQQQFDVLGEPVEQAIALRQAGAALEQELAVVADTQLPQHLGDPVVLVDQAGGHPECWAAVVSSSA